MLKVARANPYRTAQKSIQNCLETDTAVYVWEGKLKFNQKNIACLDLTLDRDFVTVVMQFSGNFLNSFFVVATIEGKKGMSQARV